MYSGFVGTVISHICSFISTLWAAFQVRNCGILPGDAILVYIAFLLMLVNSCLAFIRYGNSDIGYKLIPYHVVTLNSCAIISFTLFQTVFLRIYNTSTVFLYLNAIPFLYNVKTKYYRVHFKWSDIIIAVNSLILIYNFILYENYYGVSLYLSYLFGYFVIGETGCIFDTELPSIDAFQYLICFLNYFTVTALCY